MKTSKMILNLIAGICLSQGVLAADIPSMVPSPNLEGLFKECGEAKNSKGVSQILDTFYTKHEKQLDVVKSVCREINHEGFYHTAAHAGVGTLKNRAMVNWCALKGYPKETIEPGKLKNSPSTSQLPETHSSAKKPSATKEKVKLLAVKFETSKNVEDEQKQLEKNTKELSENLEVLRQDKHLTLEQHGKIIEIEQKIKEAEAKLKEAQEHYNNLAAAIMGMREDLQSLKHELKVFKPDQHQNASPEDYLKAAEVDLRKEDINSFSIILQKTFPGFLHQLDLASDLLKQSKQNLESARLDLVKVNEEVLNFTH